MPTTSGAPGFPASNKNPGTFFKITFGASANASGGGPRSVLIFANKTSTGTGTVDTTVYDFAQPSDASPIAGVGSEMHILVQAAFAKAPGATVKGILVAEPGGGVAAFTTLTVVGTAGGTVADTLSLFIHRVQVDVTITPGQSVTTQATNIAAAINAKAATGVLMVTATSSLGVVNITCRQLGTRGNAIPIRRTVGTGITTSTYTLAAATLTGGTGTDVLTNALATAAANRYNYYVPAQTDTTNLQLIQTQLLAMAGPLVGKVQQCISAATVALSTATTQAQALNEPRMQILWAKSSEDIPGVIAACWAGIRSVEEENDASVNLTTWNPDVVDLWPVVGPPQLASNYPTTTDTASALDVGLTPIGIRGDGHPQVLVSITTHSQDSSGNPDTRTLCTNFVTVPDTMRDGLAAYIPTAFPNCKIISDAQAGGDPLPPRTTTPNAIKGASYSFIKRTYSDTGMIAGLDDDAKNWNFDVAGPASPGRCNSTQGVHPAMWLFQYSAELLVLSA